MIEGLTYRACLFWGILYRPVSLNTSQASLSRQSHEGSIAGDIERGRVEVDVD